MGVAGGAGGEGGYPYIKYQNFEEPNLLSGNHVTLHRRRDYIQPSKPLAEIYPAYQIKASRRQLPPVEFNPSYIHIHLAIRTTKQNIPIAHNNLLSSDFTHNTPNTRTSSNSI